MKKYIYTFIAIFFVAKAFAQESNINQTALTGFVDMHTHPRSDLAFGTQLFFGAPYGDISVALASCKVNHSKNIIRKVLVSETEKQNYKSWKDGNIGYPNFATWPAWCATLHQQMWVDWIERAHNGGLNIIVALAVSSHTLSFAGKTSGSYDDKQVMLNCIQGIKELVAHTTFMEIALSPQDVRRIVGNGKLAVILGSEMDNIGNFYSPADKYKKATFNPNPTNEQIQTELDTLWELGIRYIFPVHLNNTIFGGTSLMIPTLNVANKFVTGAEFIPEQINTKESGIGFHLQNPSVGLNPIAKMFMPMLLPKNINPGKKSNYTFWDTLPGFGHRNSLGITDKGKFAINYMFKKGFLIDIDHMSEKMATEVLNMAVANDYPVNSGHSGPRDTADNEGGRTIKQYTQIKNIGGMIGMGHCENASNFVRLYRQVLQVMDYKNIGIGSDVNGFYALPKPNPEIKVVYDSSFTKCTTGNRTWDINIDGVAHYGLLPDYIKSWEVAGMTPQEKKVFMSSAEQFTQMWEKCERNKNSVK